MGGDELAKLFENLIDKVNTIVNRNKQPETHDTSIETRANQKDGTGYDIGDSFTSTYEWYSSEIALENVRRKIYKEYEQMDTEDTEISSALDIYADNATSGDSDDVEVITINTEDDTVKEILEQVKEDLNLDIQAWSIIRNIAKYGDDFEEVVIDNNFNIVRLKHLKESTMIRNEDKFGRLDNPAFRQVREGSDTVIAEFQDWQVVHFRALTDRDSKYGRSILYSVRKVYKQLSMMEDGLVITRLTRAPLRYKHLIDTEGLTPDEAENHVDKVRRKLRKRRTINPKTGKMDLEYNPMSAEEDIFVATRQGSPANVEVLQGQSNLGVLEDIKYFQNKKLAGMKVPKAYLSIEKEINAKATLTQQDVQFARTVRRLQYSFQEGVKQIFDLALSLNGISPDTVEYTIGMPVINTTDELLKWQIEATKVKIGMLLKTTTNIPNRWIYRELLGMTDDEIDQLEIETEDEMDINYDRSLKYVLPNGEEKTATEKEMLRLKNRLNSELQMIQMLSDWKLGKEVKRDHVS